MFVFLGTIDDIADDVDEEVGFNNSSIFTIKRIMPMISILIIITALLMLITFLSRMFGAMGGHRDYYDEEEERRQRLEKERRKTLEKEVERYRKRSNAEIMKMFAESPIEEKIVKPEPIQTKKPKKEKPKKGLKDKLIGKDEWK